MARTDNRTGARDHRTSRGPKTRSEFHGTRKSAAGVSDPVELLYAVALAFEHRRFTASGLGWLSRAVRPFVRPVAVRSPPVRPPFF